MAGSRVHVFTDDAIGERDATDVADGIRRGEISAREAVDAAIVRAERLRERIDAVAFADYDSARDRAARNASGAPFGGVPTFVKDNVDVRGLPTNNGTSAYAARPAANNDPIASQFLAQGVIALGKSKLPEFGFNASTEYAVGDPTVNPWDTAYSAGASSGGSAALVAAGVVPIAHANDGGGSIRVPAAACGLVGLKLTRGRVLSSKTSRSLPLKIVSDGVLTRSVRDTAAFFAAAERYRPHPMLPAVGTVEGPARTRLRIGVLYWGMLAFVVSSTGRWALGRDFDRARMDNLSVGLRRMFGRRIARLPQALYRLRRTTLAYQRTFADYDVIVSPVLSHTTPPLGHLSPQQPFDEHLDRLLRYVGFTPLNNAAGGPAMSLPLGQTAHGLPIGVHFSAAIGGERSLLELAYEIEEARPFSDDHHHVLTCGVTTSRGRRSCRARRGSRRAVRGPRRRATCRRRPDRPEGSRASPCP